jgi:ATP-dependent Clp endopeptidase proteolytic subunit ClpP
MSKNLKPKFYEILNKSTTDSAVDVRIYGSIPDFNWDTGETNTAEQFVTDFKNLEKDYKRINIHINSPGGNLLEGFAMFNAIAASTADTHTYNDGVAFSLGGLLLFAGKTVHAAQQSLILIHNTQGYAIGDAQDMRETADIMDKFDDIIAGILSNKSGIDKKQVAKTWLAYKDTVLTAEEALYIGLVDVLETSQADIPQAIHNLYNAKSLSKDLANSFLNRQINLQVNPEEKDKEKKVNALVDFLSNLFSPKEITTPNIPPPPAVDNSAQLQEMMNKVTTLSTDFSNLKVENQALQAKNAELEKKVNEYGSQPGALPTNPVASQEQHATNASQEELYKDKPWEDPEMEFNKRVDNNRLLNNASANALNIRGAK